MRHKNGWISKCVLNYHIAHLQIIFNLQLLRIQWTMTCKIININVKNCFLFQLVEYFEFLCFYQRLKKNLNNFLKKNNSFLTFCQVIVNDNKIISQVLTYKIFGTIALKKIFDNSISHTVFFKTITTFIVLKTHCIFLVSWILCLILSTSTLFLSKE